MSDRIVVMSEGAIAQIGDGSSIYAKPVNRFVASFIGKQNFFPVSAGSGTTVTTADGDFTTSEPVPESLDGAVVAVRPESIWIAVDGETGGRENSITGTISGVSFLGDVIQVVVTTTGGTELLMRGAARAFPALAEDGLCPAAKDISMAGAVGTALMLLECSGVGARIHIDALPRPPGVPLMRWLASFPSYGFVLSVPPVHAATVLARFAARDIACAVVGEVDASRRVQLRAGGEDALLWDLGAAPFIQAPASRPVTEPVHAG